MPRSSATRAIGRPLSSTSRTPRSTSSSGYFLGLDMTAEDLLSPGQHPGAEVPAKPGPAQESGPPMRWLAPTRPRPNDRLTTEEVDPTTLRGEDRGPRRGAPTSRRDRCLCGDGRSPSACHARVRPITEKGWCSAWDSGWPEDLELERCRGRHHLLERGWFGGRRRERQ